VFVVVSRQALIASKFSTVMCAPIYTQHDGLASQVLVGEDNGLKHDSRIQCDELVSLPQTMLPGFLGALSAQKIKALHQALRAALDWPDYEKQGNGSSFSSITIGKASRGLECQPGFAHLPNPGIKRIGALRRPTVRASRSFWQFKRVILAQYAPTAYACRWAASPSLQGT
jgi:mRNA interferase MazF